jgi:formamidopyrimidine-DNA glycosylase
MPELPEVQTTVDGLKKVLPGLKIKDVWSDLPKKKHKHKNKETIKDLAYFNEFRRAVIGKKFTDVKRRAKNILIFLNSGKTILIHMKMTGHLLYGPYRKSGQTWEPAQKGALEDPYNRFVHVVFSLSNGKHLAFSDTRKFGKVVLIDTDFLYNSPHLKDLGPEPLEKSFLFKNFKERLTLRPNQKIKLVLMDQSVISGIGNIYSDEILWHAGIHPEEKVKNIGDKGFKKVFSAMKTVLRKGIDFGGDSMSDYRNIKGEPGKFQLHHEAYRRTGGRCRKNDGGVIIRKKISGRSAHFCSKHQK